MPIIPTATSKAPYQGTYASPERASVYARELGRAGERVADLGRDLMRRREEMQRVEEQAQRAEQSLRIENQMNEDMSLLAESYNGAIDYENFESRAETELNKLNAKYTEMAGNDRQLGIAVGRHFNRNSATAMQMVRHKKRQVMVERALGEHYTMKINLSKQYAEEPDEERREMIGETFKLTTFDLADSRIMSDEQAGREVVKFFNDADQLRLEKIRHINAETALDLLEAGGFPGLKPDVKQEEIERTQKRIDTDIRKKDREEAVQAKARKKIVEDNDFEMWIRYHQKTLVESDLEDMAKNRMISEGAYNGIRERLKRVDEAEENNPIVVGDIAEQVGLHNFDGALNMLEDAHNNGQVKGETYISTKKAIASKSYADGIGYINKAMQPSELDFDFYRKQKHAVAITDYTIRVAGGEDPIKAAKDIVKLNASTAAVNYTRYRKPRYLTGEQDSLTALDMAEAKTVDALRKDKITAGEYRRELELIQSIKNALEERAKADRAVTDIDAEISKRKVGK